MQQNDKYHKWFISLPSRLVFHLIGEIIAAVIVIPPYKTVIADEIRTRELLKLYPEGSYRHLLPWAKIVAFDVFHPWAPYIASFVGVMFAISQSLSIACCWYIISTLKKNSSSFSATTYRMHLQLTRTLLIQLICPFIFVVVPISGFMLAAILRANFPTWTGEISMMMVAIFPMISNAINIVCITPYWKFTKDLLRKFLMKLKLIKDSPEIAPPVLPLPSSTMSFSGRQL